LILKTAVYGTRVASVGVMERIAEEFDVVVVVDTTRVEYRDDLLCHARTAL
jgi:hypothetical protein